ncbi:TPA: glycosyltransferase family 2 protein [Vibrio parahaemolyticus]|nr:glycosyltransferase family 2 protein [Vibrio parahaemolyticus]
MLVSVVIPAYKASDNIELTLDSIKNQTYSNIEVVIVDDFSDDYFDLKEKVSSYDGLTIKLIRQEANKKASAARNRGAREASGEILAFLDADDIWYPTKIEKQLSMLKANTLISSRINVAYSDDIDSSFNVTSEFDSENTIAYNLFSKLEHNLIFQTSSLMMYKLDFFLVGGFDESLSRHQDFQFVFDCEMSGLKLDIYNEVLVTYIKSKSSNISNKGWSIDGSIDFIHKYENLLKNELKLNFFTVQLLGPSIKTRQLFYWFRIGRRLGFSYLELIFSSLKYISSRLVNEK